MVPSRLAADGGHANALEFLMALETLYGVHQRYWMGVGDLSIMVGDKERAVSALERVLEAHPDRSDIASSGAIGRPALQPGAVDQRAQPVSAGRGPAPEARKQGGAQGKGAVASASSVTDRGRR